MPKCKKSLKNEICQGCLSKGRRLLPIKEYLDLYNKLIEEVLCETNDKKIPMMCCDCRNTLKHAQKFREKAVEAYKSLVIMTSDFINSIHAPHQSTLINLTTSNIQTIDDTTVITENTLETVDKEVSKEVKREFEHAVEEIKEENLFDIKTENDNDAESINDDEDYIESLNEESGVKKEINFKEMEVKYQIKLEKAHVSKEPKYKIVTRDYKSFTNLCSVVKIDENESQRCKEVMRHSNEYLNKIYKCDNCVISYNKRQKYEKHLEIYHSESNTHECTLCEARFSTSLNLIKHLKTHRCKYVCVLCNYERFYKNLVMEHIARDHYVAYECLECGLRFNKKYKEFYKHYNSIHRIFICDYCGFRSSLKERLANHIRIKHSDNICKYCNKKYLIYHSMTRHIQLRHTKEISEESYCVECNMQFDNILLYKKHLKTSVKHKPKIVFPCPECPNVYAKKTAMTNHYKYIHLQKTNYYCDKCSRYFLNGFRLRTHIATYHNKIPAPKTKICPYCGRGFVTNRILDNHIRTHTGERPFACSHCAATFAQKSALVTHTRAIHKVMMRYGEGVKK